MIVMIRLFNCVYLIVMDLVGIGEVLDVVDFKDEGLYILRYILEGFD